MTEFGNYIFVALLATIISFIIYYFIIRQAVLSALKEHSASAEFYQERQTKLLEFIADSLSKNGAVKAYDLDQLQTQYKKEVALANELYFGEPKRKKLQELEEQYLKDKENIEKR